MASYSAQITAFDISATDQAFAFGDDHNFVHIHGTCEKFDINTNRKQPEFADPFILNHYYPLMSDNYTPASEISPFVYYTMPPSSFDQRQLASYMPPNQCMRIYRPVPPIGPEILRSMRVVGNIGYVANSPGKIPVIGNNYSSNGNGSIRNSPEGNEFGTDQMPHRYHFLEPNYNKVDKDEYDFSRYNNSFFPGLDSTIPNAYANNMIQCLYFIPSFRSSVINHICDNEYCLICELGFLFHILDLAPKHTPCQASNFLRAFRSTPEACAFKLILPDEESLRKQFNFFKLTQQWFRFLLHQLHRESLQQSNNSQNEKNKKILSNHNSSSLASSTSSATFLNQASSASSEENCKNSFVTENFALKLTRQFQCTKCQYSWKSPYVSFPITLNYPLNILPTTMSENDLNGNLNGENNNSESNSFNSNNQNTFTNLHINNGINNNSNSNGNGNNTNQTNHKNSYISFAKLLRNSINTEQKVQEFCNNCQKFHNNIVERRLVSKLPPLLAINTGLDNENARKFWQSQTEKFIKSMESKKDRIVVNNLANLKKDDHQQQLQKKKQSNSTTNVPPCRYGQQCKRFDCKFYHSHRDQDNEILFYSWIPMSIYLSKNSEQKTPEQSFEIKDQYSDWNADKKADYIEYSLVNVTSVVKSSEETFGNIVSAIKIDKSYFDQRRKLIAKKMKRKKNQPANNNQGSMISNNSVDSNDLSDDSTTIDENEKFSPSDENEMYTIESRYPCLDGIENIPNYDPKMDWYLFNHYLINPICMEEVVSNDLNWKIPSILMYMRKDLMRNQTQNKQLRKVKNTINNNVFMRGFSVSKISMPKKISFLPLDLKMEFPQKGDLVAMDAEFVMLNHEESELRSDGTRATIKPSHKSVARITCVRGSGRMKGIPFIDDYISTQDQVADYMTKFSGIQPGDLDASLSSKHLTTLKSTYLKLRFLVDKGIIFVGHGLRNDFRVINLVVPPEQVIDTVFLFQSPNSKRMVSLRFLAWHFLNINIQSETHDSIEDAKTALALFEKYKELEQQNCAKEAIENLYQIGKETGWKIPDF
ncbi:ubiquitin specific protease-like protein 1 [Sarcoptes scabiei]|uniref:Ubiquitin specific protease-like protein 1 n=1 Tax=Sarcoptes scabiei TaxID=52283 RepID=A0A131ZV71_SARSC|nr:ubiquitin specific protease-like protein 1 [Sarcoptes scabiei]